MTTQANFLTAIRRKLYELNADRFPDTFLRSWLNDAADDAAARTQCLRTTGNITAVAGTQLYTPSFTDILAVHAVKYVPTGSTFEYDLEYQDYKAASQLNWSGLANSEGRPQLYWTWGYPPSLQIGLYPTPSEAGTITLHYYKTFTKLATESTADQAVELGFPGGWDRMLVNYVVAEALLSDQDARHSVYRELYEQQLAGLNDTAIRFTDNMGAVAVGRSLVPEWLYNPYFD